MKVLLICKLYFMRKVLELYISRFVCNGNQKGDILLLKYDKQIYIKKKEYVLAVNNW